MHFKKFHEASSPLLISNVWDVQSCIQAEKAGFRAIGTSSGAIAAMLGYRDGEEMSFQELKYIVQRMLANTQLPLSVDLEAGYSRQPLEIVDHIQELVVLGVVGVNLEDSLVEEQRVLVNADLFAETLHQLCQELQLRKVDLFINVRTDPFLLNIADPLDETLRRARLYEQAGANGLFVPCITQAADIRQVVENTSLPVNVMCMPDLPTFDILARLGVKRISMGNFIYNHLQDTLEKSLSTIITADSFQPIFS